MLSRKELVKDTENVNIYGKSTKNCKVLTNQVSFSKVETITMFSLFLS